MSIGQCSLCLNQRPLCNSHALPNSVFKSILRKNAGNAKVIFYDATTPARNSSDTWGAELLCKDCEAKLNHKYDAYGMAVFRGYEGRVVVHAEGVDLLSIDRQRLRMFLLSIVWRVSVSDHPNYSNIDLPWAWEEELRCAFDQERKILDSRFTIAIYKLRDRTPVNGFRNENLRDFILAPVARNYGSFISVCFAFLGFFVEAFLPRAPTKVSKRPGVVFGRSSVLTVPYLEVLDVPEIEAIFVKALTKELDQP